jgi:hypothetical protein
VYRTLSGSYTANSIYTFSFYVAKPAISDILGMIIRVRSTLGGQAIGVLVSNAGENSIYTFNSSIPFGTNPPAAITASNFSATNVGNNWVRISVTTAIASIDTTLTQWDIGFSTVSGSDTGLGTANSQIFIDSVQLEVGAFPTSYIPTTSATVTRAADNASMVGSNFSSWYNQSAGTIYSQWMLGGDNISANVYNINDTTSANYIRNRYNSAGTANDNAVTASNIVQQTLTATNQIALYAMYKNAMAYKQNDFVRSANGTLITGSTGNTPVVSQMNIGASESSVNQLNGHIQAIKYYPTRLPNADLQRLTR